MSATISHFPTKGQSGLRPVGAEGGQAKRKRPPRHRQERLKLANDAACNIDALVRILACQHKTGCEDVSIEVMQKAAFKHLLELNFVVLRALEPNDDTPIEELREVVHG